MQCDDKVTGDKDKLVNMDARRVQCELGKYFDNVFNMYLDKND